MFKNMKALPKAIIMLLITVLVVYGGSVGYERFAPKGTKTEVIASKGADTKVADIKGDSMKTIMETGVVRAGVQSPSKPFYFVEGGRAKGFNAEFMAVLFSQGEFGTRKISVDTDTTVDTYEDIPKLLLKTDSREKPVVDIAIDGLTFSNDDLPGVVYTIPYIEDFGYALIGASNSPIRSADDLRDRVIGVLKGDPDVMAFAKKNLTGATIVELSDAAVNGERSWIQNAIKSGKVDAVLYDYPFGVAEIEGTNLTFIVSKVPGSNLKYRIGVRKSDSALLENLNMAIRKAKDTPEYNELLRKYFASNKVAAVKAATKSETSYTVKKGDTLSTIAIAVLSDRMKYTVIEARNNLPNPNLIYIGQVLVIPTK